ncbi:ABCB1, partial [Symbiodinium sp. KB8]
MVQLSTSTCRGPPTTTSTATTTTPGDSPRGSRSRSPDRGAGPSGGHTSQASSSSTGRTSQTYPSPTRPQRLPEEQQFAGGVLPRWRTGAEASPTAAITAGRGELRRINPAQMAATLVEVVRHILRDTLHATSVRNELREVGELLEDVVADFGIVMNYDSAHDEFTMDPATLQDDLLRLAQQLQIVVPAHNNLLGDIRGELPSQRPSSNAQELYEGYGDELGGSSTTCPSNVATHVFINYYVAFIVLDPTRRGTQKKGIDAPFNSYQSSSASSPKAIVATDNVRQMQFGCSFEGRLRTHRLDADLAEGKTNAGRTPYTASHGLYVHLYLHYDYAAAGGQPRRTHRSRNTKEKQNPVHRARSQASQLMASIASETQAAAEYAPNAEELGGQKREAEALDLITEAMGMANDVGMPGVVDYFSASATRLSQVHLVRRRGTNRGGRPLPTPNAFEIAALTVGIMEESEQQGEPPSMAELLELLELVQAGMALLTRGRHSYNWQVTHWATDAAEEALALLTVATATDHVGELQQVQPDVGDTLPRLRNLLDEAATGVGVLVGIYPHRGETEQVHPADAIAQQEDRHQQVQHPRRDPPDALHIYKAQRHLRQLVPFLDGDMRELGNQALAHLGDWIQSHWGEPVQLLSSDDETSQLQQERTAQPAAHEAEGSPRLEGALYIHEGAAETLVDLTSG